MTEHRPARFILALVRKRWDEAEQIVGTSPLDPQALIDQAQECDVHPWVHLLLERQGRFDLVGDQAAHRLGELRAKVLRDNLLLLARAERALDLLLEAGVTPIALKGLDLLNRAYDDPGARATDDVDLLVRRDELQPALAALEGGGWQLPPEDRRNHYIRSSHHLPMVSPGPVTVDFELHWNLAQEDRFRIDVDGLFDEAVALDVSGRSVLRLEDHDLVAHLLVHHFTHYFDRRLKWLVDLQEIAQRPGFDWDRVERRIVEWNAVAAASASLAHLARLDPRLIPSELLARRPIKAWRRWLTRPLRSSHPLELFRSTRSRRVQLYLAAVMMESPAELPGWLIHRALRDRRPGRNPLDRTTNETTEERG